MRIPDFRDILLAQRQIRPYLARTPLHRYPALDALLGANVYVKHENYQPVGAFKVRGGVNLISQLSPAERGRGVIAASTGNHGQSVAFAARLFGVTARIVVPERANPGKVAAMRGMGAEVIFHGPNFDAENYAYFGLHREATAANQPAIFVAPQGIGNFPWDYARDVVLFDDRDVVHPALDQWPGHAAGVLDGDAVGQRRDRPSRDR